MLLQLSFNSLPEVLIKRGSELRKSHRNLSIVVFFALETLQLPLYSVPPLLSGVHLGMVFQGLEINGLKTLEKG